MQKLQKKVKKFVDKHNMGYSPETATLDLVSEVGEVAKEILKASGYGKKS